MTFGNKLFYTLSLQVLPKENGRRLKWNFLFQKSYWCRRPDLKDHTNNSSAPSNDHFSHENANLLETDSLEPEAITLDMKQQELDNRYGNVWRFLLASVHDMFL